jgi:glucosamine-6-phosphate deaminase
MLDYYSIPASDFAKHSKVEFKFLKTHKDLCKAFARELVDMLKSNSSQGKMTKVILPIGPLEYSTFARLCNKENVSCESLVIFSMDEYCDNDGRAISTDHPLSFHAFYQKTLVEVLDKNKRIPPEQLILPDPIDLEMVSRKMKKYGPIDVTYGGMGVNGHFAFNTPAPEGVDVKTFKNSTVHMMTLGESDRTQMVLTGTGGNWHIVPPRACTLGMKELFSAKEIHLTFMRSYHAGVMRRALFGPITAQFPGSLVQLHPCVKAWVTDVASALPPLSILMNPGK